MTRPDLNSRPHALYRFYGAGGTLLYIGITADLPTRLHDHRDDKPWWLGVTNVTVEHYSSRDAVLEAERRAIIAERPLYNSQHNGAAKTRPHERERSSAVSDLAHHILGGILDSEDAYEKALRRADLHLAEAPEDGYSGSRESVAARLIFDDLCSEVSAFRRGAAWLQSHAPAEIAAEAKARLDVYINDPDLQDWGWKASAGDAFEEVAKVISVRYAAEYLNTLPTAEREEWIEWALARRPGPPDFFTTMTAAAYARDIKAGGLIPPGMCTGPGSHGAQCPTAASVWVTLVGCRSCRPTSLTCKGHLIFCDRHASLAIDGALVDDAGRAVDVAAIVGDREEAEVPF